MGKNGNKRNSKQNKVKTKDFNINDAIFFPEDFKRIPPDCIILIKKGTIMLPIRKA